MKYNYTTMKQIQNIANLIMVHPKSSVRRFALRKKDQSLNCFTMQRAKIM